MSTRKTYGIGVDIGGTKMLAVLYDGDFKPLASIREKTPVNEGAKAVLNQIRKMVQSILDDSGVRAEQLAGIGLGCPGVLNLETGMILEAANLRWKNVPLKKIVEEWFGCPATLANDVDAGTYGEYRFGAGKNAHTLLGVFPGTGIGGGCVYQGRLLQGATGSTMEIGHIPVDPFGRLCGCGHRGCLEAAAGRLAIAAEVAQAAFRGDAPYIAKHAGSEVKKIKSRLLAKAIAAGDVKVEEIVRNAMHLVGYALGGVVNLFAPDVVVLGGGLVEAMPELILAETKRGMLETAMVALGRKVKVVPAKLGDDATVMGAVALALDSAKGV